MSRIWDGLFSWVAETPAARAETDGEDGAVREAPPVLLPAVLDLGNDTMRVLVAVAHADGSLEVLGYGEAPSVGMEEGRIVDLYAAGEALAQAVRQAEMHSEREVRHALVAVSGRSIRSYEREGMAVVGEDGGGDWRRVSGGQVGDADIARVRRMGVAGVTCAEEVVLEVVDRGFRLDKEEGIRDPRGMCGRLLAGSMHIVAVDRQYLENVEKCVRHAGLMLAGRPMFAGTAAAQAVLNEEEKKTGVCLLDVGAQTTEMVIFYDGGVHESEVLLEAGDCVHRDIAVVHHATRVSAERVKREMGIVAPAHGEAAVTLVSTSGVEMRVGQSLVLRTAQTRVEDLVTMVGESLTRFESGIGRHLTAGVVLTGGGARLPGLVAMVNHRLQMPARLGLPAYQGPFHERLRQPQMAVALGMLYAARDLAATSAQAPWPRRFKRMLDEWFFGTSAGYSGYYSSSLSYAARRGLEV